MKVIDLLVKIANGEELPKKIKIKQWEYNEEDEDLEYELFARLYNEDFELTDEVEILEEEKKIPEKIEDYSLDEKGKYPIKPTIYEGILKDKINEIIDVLEMLNDKIK